MQIVTHRRPIKQFVEDFSGKEITIIGPTGVGDVFWVYQKFAPYFDKINFDLMWTRGNRPQLPDEEPTVMEMRAIDWIKCLPKVHEVKMKYLFQDIVIDTCHQYPQMADIINAWKNNEEIFYCLNEWLNDGIRLEDIDPGSKLEWNIPVPSEPFELPCDEYALFFVGGTCHDTNGITVSHMKNLFHMWNVDVFVDLLIKVYNKYSKSWPVFVIGGSHERHLYDYISRLFAIKGIATYPMYCKNPKQVTYLMKNTKFFLHYQCGLSVWADNLNIPQIAIFLAPNLNANGTVKNVAAINAWRKNNDELFCATHFDCPPDQIVENLKLRI